MKINIKALELIEKGLSSKTVSKLDESQINLLHSKLLGEQVSGKGVTTISSKNPQAPQIAKNLNAQGVNVSMTEIELDKDDSDQGETTQTPNQKMAPDGMDDDSDNETEKNVLDAIESIIDESKQKPNPWAICHSQVGPKKSRKWERCVREVKKQLKEGKNPVSLFIENEIMKIVERNLPPKITKGDLMKYLNEGENFATKHIQSNFGKKSNFKVKKEVGENSPSTAPTTKPAPTKPGTKTPPKPKPSHPGKNPNPGENPSPKAKKVSPEKAKEEVIDVIIKLLEK